MILEVDNGEFCIRLYKNVAYLKVIGIQDKSGADFFEETIDKVIEEYSFDSFASLCDLTELILPTPSVAKQINRAILKLSTHLNYGHNAVIVEPKFLKIMQAYIFSFFLRNLAAQTKIFKIESKAIHWLSEANYELAEIEVFLNDKNKFK